MNAGTITNNGTIVLDDGAGVLDWDESTNNLADDTEGKVFTTFNLNGGTFRNAGDLVIEGVFNVNEGDLVSSADTSKVILSGSNAELNISLADLDGNLSDSDPSDPADGNVDFEGTVSFDGGLLNITDDAKVELGGANANLKFVAETGGKGGLLVGNGNEGTLRAVNLSVTDVIQNSANVSGSLTVEATNLTLGDDNGTDSELSTLVGDSDNISFVSLQNVQFDGKGSENFIIDRNFSLVNKTDAEGSMTGDNITVSADVTLEGKVSSVLGITVAGGNINVGSADFEGNTVVTLTGTLTADKDTTGATNSSYNLINVTGKGETAVELKQSPIPRLSI